MKKISRHFTTTTGILTCLAAILIATSAQAAQTKTVSFSSGTQTLVGTYSDFLLGKFDTGLGTLTGVEIKVDFSTLAGSFTVTSQTASTVSVTAFDNNLKLRQKSSNSLGFTATTLYIESATTSPNWTSTSVGGNSSEVFTIVGGQSYTFTPQNISSGYFSAYQSVGGVGSVVLQAMNTTSVGVFGGSYGVNSDSTGASTKMTVTYTYDTVPEPGTIGLLAVAGGVILLAVRRRRA